MVFVAGHFGEWLQGRLGPEGPLALITLMCRDHGVRGSRRGDGPLQIDGAHAVVDPEQVHRCLDHLQLPAKGHFTLQPSLPPGGGAGMSTAALVALSRLAGALEGDIPAACLRAEGASDPLMFPHPDRLLWAPREARVLKALDAVPACELVGGFWGAPQRTDPADTTFPEISDLVEAWQGADLPLRAHLASLSAERCSALRGPADDPMPDLVRRLGALGHARAHTGPARALIFAPGAIPDDAAAACRAAGLTHVFRFSTGGGA